MEISVLPDTLEEAIDLLKTFYKEEIPEILGMTESDFVVGSHHAGGQFIRNQWQLWWHEGHGYPGWSGKKPKLNAWFNGLGITHADDMSSIIMTCLYRNLKGQEYEVDKQVEKYKEFWKGEGFRDGIYDTNRDQ